MPPLENQRHERFCQALFEGKPANAAYQEAGYKPHDGNCIRLKGNERIKARVVELQTEAARSSAITVESICAELDAANAVAREKGQANAMVSASALRAKLAGLLKDRVEITNSAPDYDEPDEAIVERLSQHKGGRKLTEPELAEATAYFRQLFDQLGNDFYEFIGALTARPINKPENDLSVLRGIAGTPASTLPNSQRR